MKRRNRRQILFSMAWQITLWTPLPKANLNSHTDNIKNNKIIKIRSNPKITGPKSHYAFKNNWILFITFYIYIYIYIYMYKNSHYAFKNNFSAALLKEINAYSRFLFLFFLIIGLITLISPLPFWKVFFFFFLGGNCRVLFCQTKISFSFFLFFFCNS